MMMIRALPVQLGAALLAAGVLLLAWLLARRRRGRENWQFAVPGIKPLSTPHANRIKELCRSGVYWKEIMANESLKYLAKYDGDEANAHCTAGRDELTSKISEKGAWERGSKGCKHGRCPTNSLRVAGRPCLNRAKTKCCNEQQKMCRTIETGGEWSKAFGVKLAGDLAAAAQAAKSGAAAQQAEKEKQQKYTEYKKDAAKNGWRPDIKRGGHDTKAGAKGDEPADRAVIYYKDGRKHEVIWGVTKGSEPYDGGFNDSKAGGIVNMWIPPGKYVCLKNRGSGADRDAKRRQGPGPKWAAVQATYTEAGLKADQVDDIWLTSDNC